jgi:hypothetical protein
MTRRALIAALTLQKLPPSASTPLPWPSRQVPRARPPPVTFPTPSQLQKMCQATHRTPSLHSSAPTTGARLRVQAEQLALASRRPATLAEGGTQRLLEDGAVEHTPMIRAHWQQRRRDPARKERPTVWDAAEEDTVPSTCSVSALAVCPAFSNALLHAARADPTHLIL